MPEVPEFFPGPSVGWAGVRMKRCNGLDYLVVNGFAHNWIVTALAGKPV